MPGMLGWEVALWLAKHLNFDDDGAMPQRKKADESGHSFRKVMNLELRRGFLAGEVSSGDPNIPQPRSMGGARVDLDQALSLAASLNDDALIAQLRG